MSSKSLRRVFVVPSSRFGGAPIYYFGFSDKPPPLETETLFAGSKRLLAAQGTVVGSCNVAATAPCSITEDEAWALFEEQVAHAKQLDTHNGPTPRVSLLAAGGDISTAATTAAGVVGLDGEWVRDRPTAVIQIGFAHAAFVFHIANNRSQPGGHAAVVSAPYQKGPSPFALPGPLRKLLCDASIAKAGVNVDNDAKRLEREGLLLSVHDTQTEGDPQQTAHGGTNVVNLLNLDHLEVYIRNSFPEADQTRVDAAFHRATVVDNSGPCSSTAPIPSEAAAGAAAAGKEPLPSTVPQAEGCGDEGPATTSGSTVPTVAELEKATQAYHGLAALTAHYFPCSVRAAACPTATLPPVIANRPRNTLTSSTTTTLSSTCRAQTSTPPPPPAAASGSEYYTEGGAPLSPSSALAASPLLLGKDLRVTVSNWEANVLSVEQIEYAGDDALAGHRVACAMLWTKLAPLLHLSTSKDKDDEEEDAVNGSSTGMHDNDDDGGEGVSVAALIPPSVPVLQSLLRSLGTPAETADELSSQPQDKPNPNPFVTLARCVSASAAHEFKAHSKRIHKLQQLLQALKCGNESDAANAKLQLRLQKLESKKKLHRNTHSAVDDLRSKLALWKISHARGNGEDADGGGGLAANTVLVLSTTGHHIFTCDTSKAKWYVQRRALAVPIALRRASIEDALLEILVAEDFWTKNPVKTESQQQQRQSQDEAQVGAEAPSPPKTHIKMFSFKRALSQLTEDELEAMQRRVQSLVAAAAAIETIPGEDTGGRASEPDGGEAVHDQDATAPISADVRCAAVCRRPGFLSYAAVKQLAGRCTSAPDLDNECDSAARHWGPVLETLEAKSHVPYAAIRLLFEPKAKSKLCMNWQLGACHFGPQCPFAHGIEEIANDDGVPHSERDLLANEHFHSEPSTEGDRGGGKASTMGSRNVSTESAEEIRTRKNNTRKAQKLSTLSADDYVRRQTKKVCCAICMSTGDLITHAIVPPSLRKFLPSPFNMGGSADFVLICLQCNPRVRVTYDIEWRTLEERAQTLKTERLSRNNNGRMREVLSQGDENAVGNTAGPTNGPSPVPAVTSTDEENDTMPSLFNIARATRHAQLLLSAPFAKQVPPGRLASMYADVCQTYNASIASHLRTEAEDREPHTRATEGEEAGVDAAAMTSSDGAVPPPRDAVSVFKPLIGPLDRSMSTSVHAALIVLFQALVAEASSPVADGTGAAAHDGKQGDQEPTDSPQYITALSHASRTAEGKEDDGEGDEVDDDNDDGDTASATTTGRAPRKGGRKSQSLRRKETRQRRATIDEAERALALLRATLEAMIFRGEHKQLFDASRLHACASYADVLKAVIGVSSSAVAGDEAATEAVLQGLLASMTALAGGLVESTPEGTTHACVALSATDLCRIASLRPKDIHNAAIMREILSPTPEGEAGTQDKTPSAQEEDTSRSVEAAASSREAAAVKFVQHWRGIFERHFRPHFVPWNASGIMPKDDAVI